jgi:hypothetical protein
MLALLATVAQACVALDAASLADRLDDAEQALLVLDIPGFVAATDALREQIACVEDALPAELVARVHRLEGFRRWGDREPDAALAFAAARAADPDWTVPEELAPLGSPLRRDVLAVEPARGGERVPAPAEGVLWIDGRPSRQRPTDRPAVVQLVDGSFARWTVYRDPEEPLPTYEVAPRGALRRHRALR